MKKKSFVIYTDAYETLKSFPDHDLAMLFHAIFRYASGEELPEMSERADVAFSFMKRALDENEKKWEAKAQRCSEAGKRSAEVRRAKRTLAEVSGCASVATNTTDVDSVNEPKRNVTDVNSVEQNTTSDANVDSVKGHETNQTVTVTDTDTETATDTDTLSYGARAASTRVREGECEYVFEKYNEICTRLTPALELTDSLKGEIVKMIGEYGVEDILHVFEKANQSDFCAGLVTSFKADLPWILQKRFYLKVKAGGYSGKTSSKHKPSFNDFEQRDYDFDALERQLRRN